MCEQRRQVRISCRVVDDEAGIDPCISDLYSITVAALLWPPAREALSYNVTRCRWLNSQAADSPEIPLPTTAISIRSATR
jgi:hypothetical protein